MTAKMWSANVDRRKFLGVSGLAAAGLLLGTAGRAPAAGAGKVMQYAGGSAESESALDDLFPDKHERVVCTGVHRTNSITVN